MKKQKIALIMLLLLATFITIPFWGKSEEAPIEDAETELHAGFSASSDDIAQESMSETFSIEENDLDKVSVVPVVPEKEYMPGYVTATVNVRKEPNTNSEILGQMYFMNEVNFYYIDDRFEWCAIEYDDTVAYVYADYIVDLPCEYTSYSVPDYKGFKSWMPYTAITVKSSKQYKLQQIAYTGDYGIRMVENRYCVALGQRFSTEIGQYFDLILENGTVIPCVLGDSKGTRHTDSTKTFTVIGNYKCASEFIIDKSKLDKTVKVMGDFSTACDEWNSKVVEIVVYEKNVFE